MRITLCGSVKFAPKIVEIYHRLERMGHTPLIHDDMFGLADGTAKQLNDRDSEHWEVKKKYGFIRWWHDCIKSGDAILVCNFDNNGIKNNIGGNTFLEIGFAHVNGKKIFLLNPIPEEVPYADEIKAMADVVLHGDLTKIS
jgi:hypothetical protein